tara:strand:+ start:857 stop:1594 length:738 start_codon:yes stop_codon:yes gene_type:complete
MKSNSRLRIIGKIEIKSENVVKPIFFEGLKKIGNPIKLAQKYYREEIDEILLIDIVASLYRRGINFSLLKEISNNLFIPLIYGGGIKNLIDIENCLQNGADKVSINTNALKNLKLIKDAVKTFGSQCISINIDAKKINNDWFCFSDGGRINSKKKVINWIREVQDLGVGEIIVQSIDTDGYTCGPDFNLYKKIYKKVKVPFVLCSGIRKIKHVKKIKKNFNPEAIVISSALHYGELKPKTLKKVI